MSDRPRKPLHELDIESPEYWERVLKDHRLGIYRGRNTEKLSLRGGLSDLERVESERAEERLFGGRKVRPKGAKPE